MSELGCEIGTSRGNSKINTKIGMSYMELVLRKSQFFLEEHNSDVQLSSARKSSTLKEITRVFARNSSRTVGLN